MSSGLKRSQGGSQDYLRHGTFLASLKVSRLPEGTPPRQKPLEAHGETWGLLRTSQARGSQGDKTHILYQLSRRVLVLDQLFCQLGNPTPMGIAREFTGGQRIHTLIK